MKTITVSKGGNMQAKELLDFLMWVDEQVPFGGTKDENRDFIVALRFKIDGLKDRG